MMKETTQNTKLNTIGKAVIIFGTIRTTISPLSIKEISEVMGYTPIL